MEDPIAAALDESGGKVSAVLSFFFGCFDPSVGRYCTLLRDFMIPRRVLSNNSLTKPILYAGIVSGMVYPALMTGLGGLLKNESLLNFIYSLTALH